MTSNNCLWQRERPQAREFAPLDGPSTTDVLIIGAGYTGLSAAFHLLRTEPGLTVTVIEAERVGSGASGRNAGFAITLFGASLSLMKLLHGPARVSEAHRFMVGAIDRIEAAVRDHQIDCDFERKGFLKVATTRAYETRIRSELDQLHSLGINGHEWIGRLDLKTRLNAPGFLGALWDPDGATLHPVKWVYGLARLASSFGARIHEQTRVEKVSRREGRIVVSTSRGTVTARKLIYATNGYSHLLQEMRYRQTPAFTYIIATEPLSKTQLDSIGWAGREGIEDGRNFMHYFRLTPDNRILAGGGPGLVPFAGHMDHDAYPAAWDHLDHFIRKTFPDLGPIKITHRWGGGFSMTPDFTPQLGLLKDGDTAYSIGCTGHGVAMSFSAGAILADLVLDRRSELTEQWFVNRRTIPMPPEPLRHLIARSVSVAMAIDDWWCDRS